MAKKKSKKSTKAKPAKQRPANVPEGYTPEEWASYQSDPVAYCIKELKSKDSSVRFNAVDILRGCAWDAKKAIPALCELLGKEKVTTVRAQCAWALEEICYSVDARAAAQAVPALAVALGDKDAEVRSIAANALKVIGKPAKAAKAELLKARKDKTPFVRDAVESALEEIGLK